MTSKKNIMPDYHVSEKSETSIICSMIERLELETTSLNQIAYTLDKITESLFGDFLVAKEDKSSPPLCGMINILSSKIDDISKSRNRLESIVDRFQNLT